MTTIACPHCSGATRVRSSRTVTPTYRQLYFQCSTIDCGHTFAAELSITHTIVPSARPNPDIHLRIAPPRRRADNDNPGGAVDPRRGPEVSPPLAANDDDTASEAVATGE